jgi:lipopolysaccharide export system protein LptC
MKMSLQRVWSQASIYLPVFLMALLALGTWWLVRNAPKPLQAPMEHAVSDTPDYVMEQFSVHQFDGQGRLLSVMTGTEARHIPRSDTLEVDAIRTRSVAVDGTVTTSTAQRGVSNSDSSEVQLIGDAIVQRSAAGADGLEVRSNFLHAWTAEEKVKTHVPVVIQSGKDQFEGDAMDYDNLSQVINLKGRVKGVIYPSNK